MEKQSFSLYKLPLVACGVILGIYIILEIFAATAANALPIIHYEYMSWFQLLILFILVVVNFAVFAGFVMMVFYRFKINCFTKKNILLTVLFTISLVVVVFIGAYLLVEMISRYNLDQFLLFAIVLLVITPIITPLIIYFIVGALSPLFNLYNGPTPKNCHYRYWRFANLLAVLTFCSLLLYPLSLMLSLIGEISFLKAYWLGGVSTILGGSIGFIAIYLLMMTFFQKAVFYQLHFRESFITALTLMFILLLLSIALGMIIDGIFYYLAFSGMSGVILIFVGLVIFAIGYFIVSGIVSFGLRDVSRKI